MAFQVSEQRAAVGATTATVVPSLVSVIGMDDMIVELADAVFEGNTGSARWTTAVGFGILGAAVTLAPILLEISGTEGMLMIGVGAGMLGVALQAITAGDDSE